MQEQSQILYLEKIIEQIVSECQTMVLKYNLLNFEVVPANDNSALQINIFNESHLLLDSIAPPFEPETLKRSILFWSKTCLLDDFIDIQALKNLANIIGKEQTLKIFDSFAQTTEKKLLSITQSLRTRDFKQLYDTAHYVKTSAGIVGATYLLYFCDLALLKSRKKEPWTPFFETHFQQITYLLPEAIKHFRPQIL